MMNRINFPGFLILLSVLFFVSASISSANPWFEDMEEALIKARATKKAMLVNFVAPWCGWCARLRSEIFVHADFKKLVLDRLVLVVIDAEKDENSTARYGIVEFPTTLILDHEGKELRRIIGFKSLGRYLEEIDSALSESEKF